MPFPFKTRLANAWNRFARRRAPTGRKGTWMPIVRMAKFVPVALLLLSGCATRPGGVSSGDLTMEFGEAGVLTGIRLGPEIFRHTSLPAGFSLRDWDSRLLTSVQGNRVRKKEGTHVSAVSEASGFRLEADFREHPDHISCQGRILDLRQGGDRAVDVVFKIPFSPESGARWWPDILGPAEAIPEATPSQRMGSPRSSLSFAPVKARRFRLYQPLGQGCIRQPNMLWVGELEAYGRDLNENHVRSNAVKRLAGDSNAGKYSIKQVADGLRNDNFDTNWLKRGWASKNQPVPHWIEVEFAEETELIRFDVYWCRERFGYATSRQFHLEYWDGRTWRRVDAAVTNKAPRLGDAEKAQFAERSTASYTETYPLACVTDGKGTIGLGMAIPPDSPCGFRFEYDWEERMLVLTLKFGLSALPRRAELQSQAPFRFVIFAVDGRWGFRDAVQRYYSLFPKQFERVTKLDGLWLLGRLGKIPNPHHYAYAEHGEGNAELDSFWGIYTCPYVLVGQREFSTSAGSYEEAMSKYAQLDPALRSFYGPGLKEIIENCHLQRADGKRSLLLRRRGGSLNGPAVATFPMNPDPSLYEGTDRKTAGKETLAHVASILERASGVDGIYVDSLSSWGAYKNARREHFEFADIPLTHDKQGNVVMDNALAHIEFLRALRKQMPSRDKVIFGNGIRRGRAWAAFCCDVLGVEASRSVHRGASHYAFFRTVARHKPFLLLYYYNYPKMDLPREGVSEYIQSAVAFGISPETRPFGKERERDLDLYNTFIPILRLLGQAGWEPLTHAISTDATVWLERFGTGAKGLFFTLYNPTDAPKTVGITIDHDALAYGADQPIREIVLKRRLTVANLETLELPPKSLRVLQIGSAPMPPTPPALSREAIAKQLLATRREKWKGNGDLLANGSFEVLDAQDKPIGWRLAAEAPAVAHVVSQDARAGTQCIHITDGNDRAYAEAVQTFAFIQPGKVYVLSGWVHQSEKAPDPGRLYFQWRGDEGRIEQGRRLFPRATKWTRFEWTLVPPAGATTLHLALGCSRKEATELWLDNVNLSDRSQ
ncbi:MAG: carbohydrate binding domain-containing protein [Lentisphaeria bacterium]|nr:carbohydrate binding domain-containing protein [Lentisphaeria bacterium]